MRLPPLPETQPGEKRHFSDCLFSAKKVGSQALPPDFILDAGAGLVPAWASM